MSLCSSSKVSCSSRSNLSCSSCCSTSLGSKLPSESEDSPKPALLSLALPLRASDSTRSCSSAAAACFACVWAASTLWSSARRRSASRAALSSLFCSRFNLASCCACSAANRFFSALRAFLRAALAASFSSWTLAAAAAASVSFASAASASALSRVSLASAPPSTSNPSSVSSLRRLLLLLFEACAADEEAGGGMSSRLRVELNCWRFFSLRSRFFSLLRSLRACSDLFGE
mmetsp:Transcript_16021/g.22535  ORF Transcript_16021/g.22535 Transcript_16021/m.22535 type:complete len:231 (-) Transcript_16021:13-705(-)